MTAEVSGIRWFKSQHSGDAESCVEVAWLDAGRVGVRDSKNPTGPALIFTPGGWDAFTARVKVGGFTRSR
ncbi:DUF397 domain-containing protein [Nocardia asteroides]